MQEQLEYGMEATREANRNQMDIVMRGEREREREAVVRLYKLMMLYIIFLILFSCMSTLSDFVFHISFTLFLELFDRAVNHLISNPPPPAEPIFPLSNLQTPPTSPCRCLLVLCHLVDPVIQR